MKILKNKLLWITTLVMIFISLGIYVSSLASVTTYTPTGGQWIKDFPMNFTFAPSGNATGDTTLDNDTIGYATENCTVGTDCPVSYNCTLYHNVKGTWAANYSLLNIIPDTSQNFTEKTAFGDDNSGYIWNVLCKQNETAEATWYSENRTFKVDTTAPTVTKLSQPGNSSVIGNLNPFINWTITTETNFLRYKIQFSNSSSFNTADILKEEIITAKATNQTYSTSSLTGNTRYYYRILAEDQAGNTNYEYFNITVVSSAPVISIVSPADNYYSKNNSASLIFNITATHQFLDTCQIWFTNTSPNMSNTKWNKNQTSAKGVNGTVLFANANFTDGIYKYSYRCNNTGGNWSAFTTNRTVTVDTIKSDPFACIYPTNGTKSTDHTPEIRWNVSTDANFGYYTIWVSDSSSFAGINASANISSQSTTSYALNLRAFDSEDRNWYLKVNVTDLAGNTIESTNCSSWYYKTDVTNHYLKSGWSMISIMGSGTINASELGSGLGASWETISRYNQSKAFNNYNNGSTTNNGMIFKKGDPVFINVNADTYWENQTWDTDSNYNAEKLYNLTNTTTFWNVMGIQNQSGRTMGNIEYLIDKSNVFKLVQGVDVSIPANNSLNVIVFYNNSAVTTKKYVVHPYNYSLANDTTIDFGEVVWINYNSSYGNLTTSLGDVGYLTVNRSKW